MPKAKRRAALSLLFHIMYAAVAFILQAMVFTRLPRRIFNYLIIRRLENHRVPTSTGPAI